MAPEVVNFSTLRSKDSQRNSIWWVYPFCSFLQGIREQQTTSFTQDDLNHGSIIYHHQAIGSTNDSVLLEATNGVTKVGPIRLEIDIIPILLPLQVQHVCLDVRWTSGKARKLIDLSVSQRSKWPSKKSCLLVVSAGVWLDPWWGVIPATDLWHHQGRQSSLLRNELPVSSHRSTATRTLGAQPDTGDAHHCFHTHWGLTEHTKILYGNCLHAEGNVRYFGLGLLYFLKDVNYTECLYVKKKYSLINFFPQMYLKGRPGK